MVFYMNVWWFMICCKIFSNRIFFLWIFLVCMNIVGIYELFNNCVENEWVIIYLVGFGSDRGWIFFYWVINIWISMLIKLMS